MYLIVGLGNPESDYDKTRHNMGFHVLNSLAKEYGIELSKNKFNGIYGTGIIEDEQVVLVKPQTFMNLSGEAVIKYKNFYKIENEKVIVIYDDIDLKPGEVRIRKKGGPGTHNGMKSVVLLLNTDEFPRVRVGIGMPKSENIDLIEHVIGAVPKEEWKVLDAGVEKAKNATIEILKNGIEKAMNMYN